MTAFAHLATKTYNLPLRSDRVARFRLLGKLDEGLQPGKRLILVSAPAEYDKPP